MKRVIFVVPAGVELFDLAGPVQVFHEAAAAGAAYRLVYAAESERISTEQKLGLSGLAPLPHDVGNNDLIIVSGQLRAASQHLSPRRVDAIAHALAARKL